MHKMSFEIEKEVRRPEENSGLLPVTLIVATAVILAWADQPVLSALAAS